MPVILKITLEEVSEEDYIEYATYPINNLAEKEIKVIETVNYQWKVQYKVVNDLDSKKVEIFVDFNSRYLFDDRITMEISVHVGAYEIEKKIPLEKKATQKFGVNLDQISNRSIQNENIKVSCIIAIHCAEDNAKMRGTDALFTNLNYHHDVILLVENEKFFVLKKHLAFFSNYFNHLFYGNFIETDKKEFKIQDVEARQFQRLLCITHPHAKFSIDDDNVFYLLELAARFEMPSVIAACGTYLSDFDNFPFVSLMERLELSDKHNISHLQAAVLKKLRSMTHFDYKLFINKNRDRIRKLGGGCLKNFI